MKLMIQGAIEIQPGEEDLFGSMFDYLAEQGMDEATLRELAFRISVITPREVPAAQRSRDRIDFWAPKASGGTVYHYWSSSATGNFENPHCAHSPKNPPKSRGRVRNGIIPEDLICTSCRNRAPWEEVGLRFTGEHYIVALDEVEMPAQIAWWRGER